MFRLNIFKNLLLASATVLVLLYTGGSAGSGTAGSNGLAKHDTVAPMNLAGVDGLKIKLTTRMMRTTSDKKIKIGLAALLGSASLYGGACFYLTEHPGVAAAVAAGELTALAVALGISPRDLLEWIRNNCRRGNDDVHSSRTAGSETDSHDLV